MRLPVIGLVLCGLSACLQYTPPAPPTPRTATVVGAPFNRTWDAVIDVFAQQVITIETMERASGFIVASREGIAQRTRADSTASLRLADCGKGAGRMSNVVAAYLPTAAKYNVLVRPVGDSSTVQVTVKFLRVAPDRTYECTSTGRFENDFEALVNARARQP